MSQSFIADILPWIDQDGLIGAMPSPGKWSGGNELLETSIACVFETIINGRNANIDFIKNFQRAIGTCQNQDKTFNKNPGRPDQITHDDLMGVASASKICGMQFAKDICNVGFSTGWDLSNTGKPYWDAMCKPWDRAFYMMASGGIPAWYDSILLAISILFDGPFGDPSSNRLIWLMSCSISNFNPFVDLSFFVWKKFMRKKYKNVGDMMSVYYRDVQHPYAVHGSAISF